MEKILGYLVGFIIYITVVIIFSLYATHLSRKMKPYYLEGQEGVISPGKTSAWVTVIFGTSIALTGLAMAIIIPSVFLLGTFIFLMGAAIAGFMAPSLTHMHDLAWNNLYVEGPSSTFVGTLGKQRTKIYWTDIVNTGSTVSGYWYIQSKDHQKIYWSYLYRGHRVFEEVLANKYPTP